MAGNFIGDYEVRGDEIGYTTHEGHDGWTFNVAWKPGDGEEKFMYVLNRIFRSGKQARSKEIRQIFFD